VPRVQRNAELTWEGNVARGSGTISAATGAFQGLPYSLANRIERPNGHTSPEELLARARVTDVAEAGLQRLAEAASAGCTLSALIEASARVSVTATLEGGTDGD